MRDTIKIAVFSWLFLGGNPIWASEWQPSPKPADTSGYQATLAPTVNGAPLATPDVRNLPPDSDRRHTQGFLATTTWLKGAFSTETEVATDQGGVRGNDPSAGMMRLGFMGSTGLVRYGMSYRTADQTPSEGSGHHGQRESWGEWKNGTVAIRSVVGQRTDSQAGGAGNRGELGYNRIDVSWSRPEWPHIAFSVAQNPASQAMDPLNLYPQRANQHRIEAAVGYGGVMWDAKIASTYGLETELVPHGAENHVNTQTVTGSFRPVESLSIIPAVGYRTEQQEWSSARIDAPSASISMNYRPDSQLNMTATGNYSAMRSSDRLIDVDMIGGKGIVSWELEPVRDWKPQLSLEGGYNLQVNRLMPSAQTENLSGLLRLVLATM